MSINGKSGVKSVEISAVVKRRQSDGSYKEEDLGIVASYRPTVWERFMGLFRLKG